jgi:hypothetical protein
MAHKLFIVSHTMEEARGVAWLFGKGRDEYVWVDRPEKLYGFDRGVPLIVYDSATRMESLFDILRVAVERSFMVFNLTRVHHNQLKRMYG